MESSYPVEWPQFYTASIYMRKMLLSDKEHKEIIVDSLKFMVAEKRIILYAFVIMGNHVHLIWQPMFGCNLPEIQSSFIKYTAKQLKRSMETSDHKMLDSFRVYKEDRAYQIWKRRPLSIELRTTAAFDQKLDYIHYNPVRAGLCMNPESYYYSSAGFYYSAKDNFGMLTHYSGN